MDFQELLQNFILTMPIFLLSLSVHEAAHAVAAWYCGDDTARRLGRTTLNPIAHIDPIGTLLMPALSLLMGGIAFIGWAKPVPVNPNNFGNEKRDDIIVAVAGPASNIVLSIVFFLVMLILMLSGASAQSSVVVEFLWNFANYGIVINIALAIFNMIPIPPLDGSHVVAQLLPASIRDQYRSVGAYGIFILLIIFNFVPGFRAFFQNMIWGVVDIYTSLASVVM